MNAMFVPSRPSEHLTSLISLPHLVCCSPFAGVYIGFLSHLCLHHVLTHALQAADHVRDVAIHGLDAVNGHRASVNEQTRCRRWHHTYDGVTRNKNTTQAVLTEKMTLCMRNRLLLRLSHWPVRTSGFADVHNQCTPHRRTNRHRKQNYSGGELLHNHGRSIQHDKKRKKNESHTHTFTRIILHSVNLRRCTQLTGRTQENNGAYLTL